MKCPNCQFELKNPGVNCPFCQYVLPQAESKPAPSPVPAPGGGEAESEPDESPSESTPAFDLNDPMAGPAMSSSEEGMPPEEETFTPNITEKPAPAGNQGGALKMVLILGGAFLAYKVGMFDNLLMLAGVAAPNQPAIEAQTAPAAPDPAIPAEDSKRAEAAQTETADPGETAAPIPNQTFDPLDDPRLKEMNAAAEKKLAEAEKAERSSEDEEEYGDDWLFKGRIYDMISLKPVSGANLMLMDATEQNIFTAVSDAKGRFELDVPSIKGGYRLVVDHPFYLADYFDEKKPPYFKTQMNSRRQLRSARPKHKPWIGGEQPVVRDIILYPEIPDR